MVKRRIRFGFFIIAAIFFFNPYIGTIDLLPDFIGYLFVCASISPLCEINGHFADAQKGFYKATAVAAARFALTSLMTFNNFLSNDTFILFFLFVFALLNAIFAIPALNELKRGIQYLPMYVPSKIIDRPVRRSGNTTHTDLCYIATVVFLLLHSALSVLPELFTLGVYDDIGNIDHVAQSMHSFYRAVCFFALIPIGVAWLVIVCVYFAKLCRDKDFVRSLDKLYFEKVCLNENDVLQRELKKGTGIIAAALVCSADVFVDGVNFLPSFISAALLFFAFSVMKNRISFVKRRKALCIASIVLSVVKTALEISFVDKYYYLKVTTDEVTRKAYLVLSCANLLDVAVHIILIFTALSVLREIIREHTGFSLSGNDDSGIEQLHKSFFARFVPIGIFAVLRGLTSVFYYIARPYSEWYFELAFSYHLLTCGIFALLSVLLIKRISDEISYKYSREE